MMIGQIQSWGLLSKYPLPPATFASRTVSNEVDQDIKLTKRCFLQMKTLRFCTLEVENVAHKVYNKGSKFFLNQFIYSRSCIIRKTFQNLDINKNKIKCI